jgi:hypothetical protein
MTQSSTPDRVAHRYREKVGMAVVLQGVPGKLDWGWFSRDDPRMALQTVNDENLKGDSAYKVWLEKDGARIFEPVGVVPAKVLKVLRTTVHARRGSIEAQWASYMISKRWLKVDLDASGKSATLTAYPNYPNRFQRTVDLVDHFASIADEPLTDKDIKLRMNPASLELWGREHISLPEILWTGPNP